MEIGYILQQLWRRRLWVALGLVVAAVAATSVVYKLPSLEKKSLQLGAGSTEILVDAPRSPLGALNSDIGNLLPRAGIYARLVGSRPVKTRIAQELDIPTETLATSGPQPRVDQRRGRETTSEQRGNELLQESNSYRIHAVAGLDIPVVTITTQAPTAELAVRVADATARALAGYVGEIQQRQDIPDFARVQIRQLGSAQGGTVAENADYVAAALTFFAALAGWCVLVLLAANVSQSLREARREEEGSRLAELDLGQGEGSGEQNGTGDLRRDEIATP